MAVQIYDLPRRATDREARRGMCMAMKLQQKSGYLSWPGPATPGRAPGTANTRRSGRAHFRFRPPHALRVRAIHVLKQRTLTYTETTKTLTLDSLSQPHGALLGFFTSTPTTTCKSGRLNGSCCGPQVPAGLAWLCSSVAQTRITRYSLAMGCMGSKSPGCGCGCDALMVRWVFPPGWSSVLCAEAPSDLRSS
jgi:hypothetical protein